MSVVIRKVMVTLSIMSAAILAGIALWHHYLYSPWTRDGRVRASIITVAPDVSGQVMRINVRDNQQVKKGEVIFTIDETRFRLAEEEARQTMQKAKAQWAQSRRQYQRREQLAAQSIISREDIDSFMTQSQIARQEYLLATTAWKKARLDLERTRVRAPVDGSVVNMGLREGNYVSQGKAVLSLVERGTLYITGYFEETRLQQIHTGDSAEITLMSDTRKIHGRVTGISGAIANNNTATDSQLLPTTQQTFNWVRLAQRIPVDIRLTSIPSGTVLSAGMTVSVRIRKGDHNR
jgi:RND family efflux transporter MFP subunit